MKTTVALLVAVGGVMTLAACTIGSPEPSPPATPTTAWGSVEHDTAPFRTHFPALGTPTAASWTKGVHAPPSSGRIDLPGPSSTRLAAIVDVDPAVAARLRTRVGEPDPYDSAEKPPVSPEVAPELRSALPDGPYIVGRDNLDTTYGWDVVTYVHRDRPVVVLVAFLPWATGFNG